MVNGKIRIVNVCMFFLGKNYLKKKDALSPQLFNFVLEHAIREVQENHVGQKLNETHRLQAHANDVNLYGGNIDTIKKTQKLLIGASKEVSLEVNAKQIKYM
jgi:hypothetical protein